MAKYCPTCGTALADNAKFCTQCGYTLNEAPEAPAGNSVSMPPPAASQAAYYTPPQPSSYASPPVRACPRCGAALDYDAVFCDVCGVSLNGAPQQVRPAAPKKNKTGLIVALTAVLLAAIGVGIYFLLRDKQPSDQPTGTNASSLSETTIPSGCPTGSAEETVPPESDPFGNESSMAGIQIPDGMQRIADAGLNDAAGLWKGQFLFTALDGYESVPGAPDNIDQMIEQLKNTPADMELELETDRSWGINLEGMMPLDIRSVDMMVKEPKTQEEASIHLFHGPEQGLVSVGPITMIEQDESGLFEIKAVLCKDQAGELLVGNLLLEMAVQGAKVRLTGNFTLYREGGAEPAVPTSEADTEAQTEAPTQTPTAAPTEAPTEPPAEKPTEPASSTEILTEVEEPEELDFLWIYSTNDPTVLPDGATELTELSEILGAWKVLYVFDGDGDIVRYLGRLYLDAGQNGVLVRVDPAQIDFGQGWLQDPSGDYTLDGKLKNGALMSSSISGNLVINTFYLHSKWEYGIGEFTVPSGEKARVYLVRP